MNRWLDNARYILQQEQGFDRQLHQDAVDESEKSGAMKRCWRGWSSRICQEVAEMKSPDFSFEIVKIVFTFTPFCDDEPPLMRFSGG